MFGFELQSIFWRKKIGISTFEAINLWSEFFLKKTPPESI